MEQNKKPWSEKLTAELLEELRLMTPARIKTIRAKYKLTQVVFADLCGISYHTYKNWEIGHRNPCTSGVALLKLAEQQPQIFLERRKKANKS